MNSVLFWYHFGMVRDFIIDGYNLMHAAGFARPTYGPGGLERSRNRLLARLAELLTSEERQRTTIVFDAKDAPPGRSDTDMWNNIYVLFARDSEEADDLIEKLIARHSAPKQLLVVSSDHRLHKAARRRKANACDSDRFLDRLERRTADRAGEESPAPDEQESELSDEQMQHWLKEFSDVDVDQIREEVGEKPKPNPSLPDAGSSGRDQSVPQLDENELDMWEHLLGDILREQERGSEGGRG